MLEFCGLEKVTLDANGRVKFSSRVLADFKHYESSDIVFHCLPEGALAIYPIENWAKIRASEEASAKGINQSLLRRRQMRMMGAMTQKDKLSNQGRVTLPAMFREMCQLRPSEELMVVGSELGVELWNSESWAKEMQLMHSHSLEKGENEMAADLVDFENVEE